MKVKKVKIEIPEYLTIGQYQTYCKTKAEGLEGICKFLSAVTGHPYQDLIKWSPGTITTLIEKLTALLETNNEFYPIVEWEGEILGFSSISKMTLGEFIDLENLNKNTEDNLHQLAGLLYRPITSHKFNSWKWEVKSAYKLARNKVENPFNYYTLEDYDNRKRNLNSEKFKEFPVHLILGALVFFSVTSVMSVNDTVFGMTDPLTTTMTNQMMLQGLSGTTGGGLQYSISSAKQASSTLQAITV